MNKVALLRIFNNAYSKAMMPKAARESDGRQAGIEAVLATYMQDVTRLIRNIENVNILHERRCSSAYEGDTARDCDCARGIIYDTVKKLKEEQT